MNNARKKGKFSEGKIAVVFVKISMRGNGATFFCQRNSNLPDDRFFRSLIMIVNQRFLVVKSNWYRAMH